MVVVTEGRLRVDRDQGPVTLAPGDHAIYSSTQAYAYVNAHHGVTRFIRNVVS
jgi:quercetin dioxygenase-like cupin family protein